MHSFIGSGKLQGTSEPNSIAEGQNIARLVFFSIFHLENNSSKSREWDGKINICV